MTIGSHDEYELSSLTTSDLDPSPFEQLSAWVDAADGDNAMTIATVSSSGAPSARVVLLRGLDADGLVFYTNYESRKGSELDHNPHIAAVFFWPALQRQVRVEGVVARVSTAESDAYFAGRPIKSQMGAVVSTQSAVIPNRQVLEDEMARLEQLDHIDRPSNWGGYRITPSMFEFWQGRRSRLHDRLRYQLTDGAWKIDRLAP